MRPSTGPGPFVTASAVTMTPSATAPSTVVDGEPPPSPTTPAANNHPLLFKKRKVLPHPRKDAPYAALRGPRPPAPQRHPDVVASASSTSTASSAVGAASDDVSEADSHASSPRAAKQYPKTLGNGPDLPPTPPAHSRNSSATYSALPSSATYVQSPERSTEDMPLKPLLPTTPTKQMSPPTPDVTPPHALQLDARTREPPSRPPVRERNLSKGTSDSRTASFRTAREHPSSSSSDDDGAHASLRLAPVSARTSESTVRRLPKSDDEPKPPSKTRQPKAVGLGLGLESSPDESITPRSKREFSSFDGEWGSGSEERAKECDSRLNGNSNAALWNPQTASPWNAKGPVPRDEVIEDLVVSPTNATKALRAMPLPQRILTFPSPTASQEQPRAPPQPQQQSKTVRQQPQPQQQPKAERQPQQQQRQARHPRQNQRPEERQPEALASAAPIVANMALSSPALAGDKPQRSSTVSSKSTVSTVIEAVVVGSPPQRRRTLRHVKKQGTLRDSGFDLSPASSATTSLADETAKQRRPNGVRTNGNRKDSVVSTATVNSIASRSARREIWKAGGIPVVVVPSRMSSVKSVSREPSLRSTSSRRSRRSQSLHSIPPSQLPKSREISPGLSQHRRRGREPVNGSDCSARDGSAPGDQRTIDFPPVIPKRSSSLSAPTSRNASRSGSLTAESLHAHTALLTSRIGEQSKAGVRAEAHVEKQAGQGLPTVSLAEQTHDVAQLSQPLPAAEDQPRKGSGGSCIDLFPNGQVRRDSGTELSILPRRPTDDDHEVDHGNSDGNDAIGGHLDPRSSLDRHVERNSARHLSPHNTPFSMVSVETTTTHHSIAEVSEALAVSIYPHQNTSVLVVDHSTRPSDCSDDSQPDRLTDYSRPSTSKQEPSPVFDFASSARAPSFVAASPAHAKTKAAVLDHDAGERGPVTPLQQLFSLEDVDSPLRNPRSPPNPPNPAIPPAINFIPATPSGMTPSVEQDSARDMDATGSGRPRRRSVSLVLRHALSRGRGTATEYGPSASRSGGLLRRTLSLTRDVQKRARSVRRSNSVDRGRDLVFDDEPAEGDKLHPYWRPASAHEQDERGFDGAVDDDDEDETYRYPPIDNRPHAPRRSLSARMKRTFAILPLDDAENDVYPATGDYGLDRRTVRRTPSGNLRVVKHRGSVESFGHDDRATDDQRPYTAPEQEGRRFFFWRSASLRRANSHANDNGKAAAAAGGAPDRKGAKILPQLGDKIGAYGPHTIPRRFSERRREKRSNELRQMISAPQEVRDGVGEVIRRTNYRDAFTHTQVR